MDAEMKAGFDRVRDKCTEMQVAGASTGVTVFLMPQPVRYSKITVLAVLPGYLAFLDSSGNLIETSFPFIMGTEGAGGSGNNGKSGLIV